MSRLFIRHGPPPHPRKPSFIYMSVPQRAQGPTWHLCPQAHSGLQLAGQDSCHLLRNQRLIEFLGWKGWHFTDGECEAQKGLDVTRPPSLPELQGLRRVLAMCPTIDHLDQQKGGNGGQMFAWRGCTGSDSQPQRSGKVVPLCLLFLNRKTGFSSQANPESREE